MLDINLFRTDLAAVAAGLAKRGVTLDTAAFEALERERKDIQTRTQELQSRRNTLSKEIGIAKGKGQDAAPLVEVWNRAMRSGPARISQSWDRTTAKLVSLGVPLPASGPETRLREYAVNYKEGAAI